jgi:hypothetical protein
MYKYICLYTIIFFIILIIFYFYNQNLNKTKFDFFENDKLNLNILVNNNESKNLLIKDLFSKKVYKFDNNNINIKLNKNNLLFYIKNNKDKNYLQNTFVNITLIAPENYWIILDNKYNANYNNVLWINNNLNQNNVFYGYKNKDITLNIPTNQNIILSLKIVKNKY